MKAILESKDKIMPVFALNDAMAKLNDLIDEAEYFYKPIIITGKRANAVLISEDDWESVQETLYLLSVPGMRESVREGLDTLISECKKEPDW